MQIIDTCSCGAKFQMSAVSTFGTTNNTADRDVITSSHTQWLEAHAPCRERNARDHSSS